MDLADNDGPMEQLLRAVKLPVKSWTKRQTCCGAYHGFSNVEIADRLCGEILEDAQKAGARAIVTACPLCQYNLDVRQYEIGKKLRRPIYMPIYHFSEVLAYVLAPESAEAALSRHMNSDRQLVAELLKPGS
jgi:heterodisulfide reductase subunit B